jgi:hypothetical protein
MGHRLSRETLAKDVIAHLKRLKFIEVKDVPEYQLVKITHAGRDIAEGQATHLDVSQFKTGK